MSRSVTEWIGKTDDSRPPRAVRARVFRDHGGVCHISGRRIGPGEEWDLEHIKPLSMARPGENLNRETNMAPALKAPHREKTAAEAGERAKADRIHAKHFGYFPETRAKIKSRGFEPSRRKASHNSGEPREDGSISRRATNNTSETPNDL